MPLIREQRIDADGIYIMASDGREITVTRQQLRARFLQETGTIVQRRTKTIAWLKQQVQNALGAEQLPIAFLDFDFDDATGIPTRLGRAGSV